MLKKLRISAKICAAVVLIVATVTFVVYEEHRVIEKYQRECQKNISAVAISTEKKDSSPDKCTDAKDYMPWWYILVAWPEGITVWVVLATGFVIAWQSYETRKAASATENSVEGSKDTAIKQLRAYVGIKGARLFLHDDGGVEAKVEIFNCGQTPAFDFKGAHWGRFSEYPVPTPVPPDESKKTSTGIIGAGLSYHLLGDIVPSHTESRESLLRELSNPKVVFCLNGDYTYQDVFNHTQRLQFQIFVGGPVKIRIDSDGNDTWAVFCNDKVGNNAT